MIITQHSNTSDTILDATLERLHTLYRERGLRQGRVESIAIKPGWIVVASNRNECGMATNCPGLNSIFGMEQRGAIPELHSCIGKPLFDIAEMGIQSHNIAERATGIAAMSALSQKFLGCNGIRRRGYLSQCWKTGDEFIQGYPAVSRLVRPDDIVAVAGFGSQVATLHVWCRELHVLHLRFPESFETVVIDKERQGLPKNIVSCATPAGDGAISRADVVFLSTSTIVDGNLTRLIHAARNPALLVSSASVHRSSRTRSSTMGWISSHRSGSLTRSSSAPG